ncbi:uncharacterized protein EDB93DRAFT_1104052 [Suillus bovinus]|uniref:uncharacterized protein n=1 Tax=Suillus bovinus TaxID=48563 RepID=UPI001B883EEE|nr:uncharacterized protein EDB93DRAFT_1104052 [Suillus bovinus]KAG2147785.1 hypothetical protein EDB93DRAFT_1104052 [Suillus bovinus]
MYCTNNACRFNIHTMKSNLNVEGSVNCSNMKYIPKGIRCRKPKFRFIYKAAFYGVACYRPFLVPVPVIDGVKTKPTLNDLYVNYWVKQRDTNALTCTRQHMCHTFDSIPNCKMVIHALYTVFFDNPVNHFTTNHLLEHMRIALWQSLKYQQSLQGCIIARKKDDWQSDSECTPLLQFPTPMVVEEGFVCNKHAVLYQISNNVHNSNVQPHACFFIAEHTGQEQAIWHAVWEQHTPKGPE